MPKMGMAAPTNLKWINIVETWRMGNQAMLFLGRPVGSDPKTLRPLGVKGNQVRRVQCIASPVTSRRWSVQVICVHTSSMCTEAVFKALTHKRDDNL